MIDFRKKNTKHPAPINTNISTSSIFNVWRAKAAKKISFSLIHFRLEGFFQCQRWALDWPVHSFNKRHLAAAPCSTLLILSRSLLLLIRTHLRQVCRWLRSETLLFCWGTECVLSFRFVHKNIVFFCTYSEREGMWRGKSAEKHSNFVFFLIRRTREAGQQKKQKKKKCNDTKTTAKRGRTSQHRHRLSRGKWARCFGCSRPKKFIELFLISLSSRCFYFLLCLFDSPGSPYRISTVIKFHFCAKNFTILKSFKLMRHDTMTTWDVCASKRGWCNCKPTSDDNHCNQRNDVATPRKLETKGDWRCRSVPLKEFWRLTRQIASKNIGKTTISIVIKLAYLDWDITIFSHRKSLMVMAEFYSN